MKHRIDKLIENVVFLEGKIEGNFLQNPNNNNLENKVKELEAFGNQNKEKDKQILNLKNELENKEKQF